MTFDPSETRLRRAYFEGASAIGTTITVEHGEPIDFALRRLKKAVAFAGISVDVARHTEFTPKAERRRKKFVAAQKRRDR